MIKLLNFLLFYFQYARPDNIIQRKDDKIIQYHFLGYDVITDDINKIVGLDVIITKYTFTEFIRYNFLFGSTIFISLLFVLPFYLYL